MRPRRASCREIAPRSSLATDAGCRLGCCRLALLPGAGTAARIGGTLARGFRWRVARLCMMAEFGCREGEVMRAPPLSDQSRGVFKRAFLWMFSSMCEVCVACVEKGGKETRM